MNVPEDCIHRCKIQKDCCEVTYSGLIIESDGCIREGGCDLIAFDDEKFFIVEIKGGNISSDGGKKILEQIKECQSMYWELVGHRRVIKLFLWCNSKRKRIDNYVRDVLKRERVRIEKCNNQFNLSSIK